MTLDPRSSASDPLSGQDDRYTVGSRPEGRGVLVELSPYYAPPRGANIFDRYEETSSGIGPGAPAAIITFTVRAAEELRIVQLGFGAVDPTALQASAWSLFVKGQVDKTYNQFAVAIGTLDAPGNVEIHVPGPATVEIWVYCNLKMGNFAYCARVRGWTYQPGKVGGART